MRNIQFNLRWPHSEHKFLQNPQIRLTQSGARSAQVQTIELTQIPIPAPPAAGIDAIRGASLSLHVGDVFQLNLSFEPSLMDPSTQTPVSRRVLSIERIYEVELDHDCGYPKLSPRAALSGGADNPLLQETWTGADLGIFTVRIETSFVDLTSIWREFSHHNARNQLGQSFVYEHSGDPQWRKLRILGYTRGNPEMWAVAIPSVLLDSRPGVELSVGRLVFFKHNDFFFRHAPTGLAGAQTGMWLINQFLLSGRVLQNERERNAEHVPNFIANDESNQWEFTHDASVDRYKRSNWVRANFQRSLERSHRPLLLIMPWRQDGLIDDSMNSRLASVTEEVARFLHSQGSIISHSPLTIGKLGISGFSGGGGIAAEAFTQNASRVSELYLFDPVDATLGSTMNPEHLRAMTAWVRRNHEARLRVVSSLSPQIWATVINEAATVRASRYPDYPQFWRPASGGGNAWFNHQLAYQHTIAAKVIDDDESFFRHQYAVNGGIGDHPDTGTSWLEMFLLNSGF